MLVPARDLFEVKPILKNNVLSLLKHLLKHILPFESLDKELRVMTQC